MFGEVARIRASQISPDELKMAKSSFAQSLTGRFETSPHTAATVGELFVYDLPLDYYNSLPSKIDAVTAADVERVAKQYLDPEKMVAVVVGDRAKVEPELKKLDLAPIALRDFDGNPVKEAAGAQ
jgi:zinc protease